MCCSDSEVQTFCLESDTVFNLYRSLLAPLSHLFVCPPATSLMKMFAAEDLLVKPEGSTHTYTQFFGCELMEKV